MQQNLNRSVLALGAALVLLAPNLAQAETCHSEIARIQKLLSESPSSGGGYVPDLPESNFATMHRQPTRESIAKAKAEAADKASALLDQARQQEADGKQAECLKTLKTIVMP